MWPAVLSEAGDAFPRDMLVRIAGGTAPWIYMGMTTAVLSLAAIWAMGGGPGATWMAGYSVLLIALVANNVYGTKVAWPRIMFAPERVARTAWHWFRVRMAISLAVGLALHAWAIIAI